MFSWICFGKNGNSKVKVQSSKSVLSITIVSSFLSNTLLSIKVYFRWKRKYILANLIPNFSMEKKPQFFLAIVCLQIHFNEFHCSTALFTYLYKGISLKIHLTPFIINCEWPGCWFRSTVYTNPKHITYPRRSIS